MLSQCLASTSDTFWNNLELNHSILKKKYCSCPDTDENYILELTKVDLAIRMKYSQHIIKDLPYNLDSPMLFNRYSSVAG